MLNNKVFCKKELLIKKKILWDCGNQESDTRSGSGLTIASSGDNNENYQRNMAYRRFSGRNEIQRISAKNRANKVDISLVKATLDMQRDYGKVGGR
jgi:hypothetical protein